MEVLHKNLAFWLLEKSDNLATLAWSGVCPRQVTRSLSSLLRGPTASYDLNTCHFFHLQPISQTESFPIDGWLTVSNTKPGLGVSVSLFDLSSAHPGKPSWTVCWMNGKPHIMCWLPACDISGHTSLQGTWGCCPAVIRTAFLYYGRGLGNWKEECSLHCPFELWFEAGFIIPNYHQANCLTAALVTADWRHSTDLLRWYLGRVAWHSLPREKSASQKNPQLLNVEHAMHIPFLSHTKSNIYSSV